MQVFKAVSSAMVGVGKRTDLEADFARTESEGPWAYIVVGLLMTVIFIVAVVVVVNLVLP